MRPWDNFFWWLEVEGLAAEVDGRRPSNWPPPRGSRAAQIESKRLAANKITVKAQAAKTTVWLSPEIVNFKERIDVQLNGRSLGPRDRVIAPDLRCCSKTCALGPIDSIRSGRS